MSTKFTGLLSRLAMEPPFRILARAALKWTNPSVKTRALWEISISDRPHYLVGVLSAAEQAKRQGISEIAVIEFGVAGGNGLVALQEEAGVVARETGVAVRVYGFDMGKAGLPGFIGDYRDHPDAWQPGDFPMDEERLRTRLAPRTTLILGNLAETVASFYEKYQPPPIGFMSVDVDLYSSARDALKILASPERRMLLHVPVYFDDIDFIFNHKFAGELLAIDEFNAEVRDVKIDRWHGLVKDRPFPDRPFVYKFFVAHDLRSSSVVTAPRPKATHPLRSC